MKSAEHTDLTKKIATALKATRKLQGLSQTELGMIMNVSFQQIQKYEKGTNRIPMTNLFHALDKMDVHPQEFLKLLDNQKEKKRPLPDLSFQEIQLIKKFRKIRSESAKKALLRFMASIYRNN